MAKDAKILILGFTFKENCPDIRNTKVIDIYYTLEEYTSNITIYDPWASAQQVSHEYGVQVTCALPHERYDVVILAVVHDKFKTLDVKLLLKEGGVAEDVKGFLDREFVDERL